MRNKLLIGLVAVTVAAPSLASAYSSCEDRAHHRRVVGTVAGAAGGALIGHMVGGKGAAAPLIGAGAGAIVGNQVAREKCPPAYHAGYHHRRHHHYEERG